MLGDLLRATKESSGLGLGELTVLSPQNEIELLEPMTDMDDGPAPLVSSSMELADAISALRNRKRYTNGGGE